MGRNGRGNDTRSSSEPHEPARPYARRRAPAIAAPLIAKTAGNCDVLLLCAGRITVIRNLFLFFFFSFPSASSARDKRYRVREGEDVID